MSMVSKVFRHDSTMVVEIMIWKPANQNSGRSAVYTSFEINGCGEL